MYVLRVIGLFVVAALAEIGGVAGVAGGARAAGAGVDRCWDRRPQGLRLVATLQPDANFGRILAAYGGVFVVGSLAWGIGVDGFRPDRWDLLGALVCLVGVGIVMFGPRPT